MIDLDTLFDRIDDGDQPRTRKRRLKRRFFDAPIYYRAPFNPLKDF